jgi:hypothetical protein
MDIVDFLQGESVTFLFRTPRFHHPPVGDDVLAECPVQDIRPSPKGIDQGSSHPSDQRAKYKKIRVIANARMTGISSK